jgi:ribosomal protein L37AE/L43A
MTAKRKRAKRCVFCKSICVRKRVAYPWLWWCDSCDRGQPDKRYPPPEGKAKTSHVGSFKPLV